MNPKTITITVDYEALLSARVALELISEDTSYTPGAGDRERMAAQKLHIDHAVHAVLANQ